MRGLFKVVAWLELTTSLEYCKLLNSIKSVLEYSNKYIKEFRTIIFRAGHVKVIDCMVKGLAEELQPYRNDANILRKVVIFLVLNSNVVFKYDIKEDSVLGPLMNVCPLLPTFLLVTLIWNLKLDEYFNELLTYTPCWFSFQFFEPSADTLNFVSDPYETLSKVEDLMKATLVSIANTRHTESDLMAVKIYASKMCDHSMNLTRQFYTPDVQKLNKFSKKERFKYDGFALRHLLRIVLHSFDVYEDKCHLLNDPMPEHLSVYARLEYVAGQAGMAAATETKAQISVALKKQLRQIVMALLNALQNNVMMVDVEKFLYWAEIEQKRYRARSLQVEVANMMFEVMERIQGNTEFNHSVSKQLRTMAIPKRPLKNTINESRLGDILRELNAPDTPEDEKVHWISGLISRNSALGNKECLEMISENVRLLTVEHCHRIFTYMKLEIDRYNHEIEEEGGIVDPDELVELEDTDISPELLNIVMMVLPRLNEQQLLSLLEAELDLFGVKVNYCMEPLLKDRLVEFINRYNNNNSMDMDETAYYPLLLILMIECPSLVWTEFYVSATNNQKMTVPFCKIVKRFEKVSNYFLMPLLKTSFENKMTLHIPQFPQFLCELYFHLFADGRKREFLDKLLHVYVVKYMESNDFVALLRIMNCLNLIRCHNETNAHRLLNFGELTAPVLLMVSQIMDKARWDLVTYSAAKEELLCECINFVQKINNRFLTSVSDKDRQWICKVIASSNRPHNQYYFQKYSLTASDEPLKFHEYLMHNDDIEDKTKIQTFLIANYLRCTGKEIEWLANCEKLLPHIYESICILLSIVMSTKTEECYECYLHCLVNFLPVVQKYLLPESADNNDKIIDLELNLLELIATSPETVYERVFHLYEPILFNILRMYKGSFESTVINRINELVDDIPECSMKTLFQEKIGDLFKAAESPTSPASPTSLSSP